MNLRDSGEKEKLSSKCGHQFTISLVQPEIYRHHRSKSRSRSSTDLFVDLGLVPPPASPIRSLHQAVSCCVVERFTQGQLTVMKAPHSLIKQIIRTEGHSEFKFVEFTAFAGTDP